jgi:hypothetical protein
MSRLPRKARDGLMRAWLDILYERYPDVRWVRAQQAEAQEDASNNEASSNASLAASAASI